MSVNGVFPAPGAATRLCASGAVFKAARLAGGALVALLAPSLAPSFAEAAAAPVVGPVIRPAGSEPPASPAAVGQAPSLRSAPSRKPPRQKGPASRPASRPAPRKVPAARPALRDRALGEYVRLSGAGPTGETGATDRIDAADYLDDYINDAGEAFFFAPGVAVNALDANEPRLSIRGFDLKNRQERASAAVFRDGAPLTDVHGDANLREIDLRAVSRVDVMRGGGDLRLSGDALGGAVNFVSPTGRDLGDMRLARGDVGVSIEGNPGGRAHAAVAGGGDGRKLDYFVSLSGGYETGFRENNDLQDAILNANVGYSFSDTFATRFFIDGVYSEARQGGGLTQAQLDDDAFQAAPPITLGPLFPGGPVIEFADGAEEGEVGRDLFVGRIANQTNFRLLGHEAETGFHFARRDAESPQVNFIGVIDNSGDEWGARLSLKRLMTVFGMESEYRVGGAYAVGEQSADRFENLNGAKGEQTVDSDHRSSNLNAYAQAAIRPLRRLLVDFGAKFIIVDRELTARNPAIADDDGDFEERRFTGVAARAGAVYRFSDDFEVFAGWARTYEPPSFGELISDNPTEFNDLEEQDTFGYEGGVRGRFGDWASWDVTYFNTDVENEIVNIDDPETNGIGDTLINLADTTHKGVEVGLDLTLFPARFARNGGALTWRSAYSYNDFTIVDAGELGGDVDGNRLAGAPQHLYRGEVRYDADGRWYAAANVEIGAGSFFVDHANLADAPTYTAVGFAAGLRLNDRIDVFASGRNLTDNAYAAGITPVLSQATQNARALTPANRAAVFAGLNYRF